ncbi:ZP domain-containing protein-like [Branchiostoma floridae x Branchiostoma belcheri]
MCYIDQRDTAHHNTPCQDLLQGIPQYGNAQQLLAAGGNFGCWHGNTGDSPGPAYASNGVIQNSCRDNIQQSNRLSSWSPSTTTFGVCIKGITCEPIATTSTAAPTKEPKIQTAAPVQDLMASTSCTNDYMELAIPVDELTDITLNDLHWEPDQNCGATTNGTHYLFRTDLYGCGTKVSFDPKYVIFLNTINILSMEQKIGVITREGGIRITSKCEYERQQWVDSTFLPIPGGLNFTEEGFGQLEVRLSMFPTRQYQTPYLADQYPIHLKLRQHIYMQLEVQGHGQNLAVLALNCKATMSPEPNDTLHYQLINDGCASDPTLDIYSVENPAMEQFGFEAFRFIQEVKMVYVHCEVMVCDAADPDSRCAQGCVARRKRASDEKMDMIGRHMIYLGPIALDDDDDAAADSLRQRRGAPWALLAAGGGLMALALVVLGAAVVRKHSRREEWAYQGLANVEGEE